MTGKQRPLTSEPGPGVGVKDTRPLRALRPPLTPGLILRAVLGVLLFFVGLVLGVWLVFRSRRSQDSTSPGA